MRILVTGGAGFIGSHLCDALIEAGHEVRALDCLDPQVHGRTRERPDYLHPGVELDVGSVCHPSVVRDALGGIDVVYHFAAKVGVGQSMYEVAAYTEVNSYGTAVLLEEIVKAGTVKKLIVASSMSVYGEGAHSILDGAPVPVGHSFGPSPTHENHRPGLPNVYAQTKYDQERLCLIVGEANKIPTTALRFFNVYGPRQALSNPYTGVIAIFASRLLNDKPPLIYEDGMQSRDFVSVYDIVHGCTQALLSPNTGVFNIGTGVATSVRTVASILARVLGKDIQPVFTGTKRAGDIRHCFANIDAAKQRLGYRPRVKLDEGLVDLAEWLRFQTATDGVEGAARELEERGLVA